MATQAHTHNTRIAGWLNDAYAMEHGIVEALEMQVKPVTDHPMGKDGIERHLEATKRHADLVKGCLDGLGESPSKLKSGMAGGVPAGARPRDARAGAVLTKPERPHSTRAVHGGVNSTPPFLLTASVWG